MLYRSATEQSEHDAVLQQAARYLRTGGRFDVHTNLGPEHRTGIGDLFPDIILTDRGSTTTRFIIEVETPTSVNRDEATQWKRYADLGIPFYVLVPIVLVAFAKQLCVDAGIRVSMAYYYRDQAGKLQVVYENAQ